MADIPLQSLTSGVLPTSYARVPTSEALPSPHAPSLSPSLRPGLRLNDPDDPDTTMQNSDNGAGAVKGLGVSGFGGERRNDGEDLDREYDIEGGPSYFKESQSRDVPWMCYVLGMLVMSVWAILATSIVIYDSKLLRVKSSAADTASVSSQTDPFIAAADIVPISAPTSDIPGLGGAAAARPPSNPSKPRFTYEDALSFSFSPNTETVTWVGNEHEDGLVSINDFDGVYIESLSKGTKQLLATWRELVDENGESLQYNAFTISADLKFLMFETARKKVFRYSSLKEYVVFDLTTKRAKPLSIRGERVTTQYAQWSPTGHSVMFIRKNNLYISINLMEERQITFDGSDTVFNGVPDWIYEEEIYEQDFTCWWGPDSKRVAYLRLDETRVPSYTFPIFETPGLPKSAYPVDRSIRYPKPGYPNPIASVHLYDISAHAPTEHSPVPPILMDASRDFADEDRLLVEVAWVGPDHLFVRAMNRVQDVARLWLADAEHSTARLVRQEVDDVDHGWLPIHKAIKYIPPNASRSSPGYIDIVINDSFAHLAYFATLDAATPASWVTSGAYEVIDGALGVEIVNGVVYYLSSERNSAERHIYSAKLDGSEKKMLTNDSDGYYAASFSQDAGWYWLHYQGPSIPWQKLKSTVQPSFERLLEGNSKLEQRLANIAQPLVRYGKVSIQGVEMNTMEILPPDFDASLKHHYAVLFRIYGGPNSQMTAKKWSMDYSHAVASDRSMQMIIVMADGRGTGGKGRKFKCPVRKHLGELESLDIVNAGRHWSQLPYVDPKRMAVWGWSYGGYLTAKITERDSGVFQAAMSVAPVTDWRFYDTVYTERYMMTPKENEEGYYQSAVQKLDGFRRTKYLVVHGSGDDNVHFQQTLHLLDKFTQASVRGYQLQVFPDNDHSMGFRGAYHEIWPRLTDFLKEAIPAPSTSNSTLPPKQSASLGIIR